jgi:hypothetical protein
MLLTIESAECLDCFSTVDLSNKGEVITCVITVISGLVIRFFEKRKLKRKNDGEI